MRRWIATAAMLLACATAAVAGDEASTLAVRDAWARATPPGAGVAAAYLTVVGGTEPDRLVGASTSVATMTQIHSVTETDGMTRMRETDSVDIPAGQRVVLAPQGLHLMLMGLAQPLVAGQRFVVTLVFEHAGAREVSVAVVAPDQAPPASQH
ncbi:MAG TPA: copper chaperone PCu(A)C [Steroidobacteraceae bacterium]|nr:copper chaperone PCu(A)C [Steroidobacteraceae bacterium]